MATTARFLHDPSLQDAANAAGDNYWCAYVPEIADQMGLAVESLAREELCALENVRVLVLPDLPEGYLTDAERSAIRDWVHAGGVLVGFATCGLDDLFGVEPVGEIQQTGDPWTYTATLRLTDAELARPLYNEATEDAPLLIFSPVRRIMGGGRELARLLSIDGQDLGGPAISLNEVGQGRACYFAFDLCQTLWALHQGRPVTTDRDGDGYYRMGDAIIIQPFRRDVPYADLLLFLLRNVVALAGEAFIAPLPPTEDGCVPDALFFWGGDDEAAEGTQIPASDWMREQGLPYHINIMPHPDGSFGLTREEFARIKANGHDTSLHFNMIEGFEHPHAFGPEDVRRQLEWYQETFGETPVCTVFHWCRWQGWSEPAEWMSEGGIQADNSRIHSGSPPLNPTNLVGYSFGTAFPFWYWADWRSGNRRINFISEQITAYECGYIQNEGTEFSQLHRAIRDAAHWHFTTNLFFHPVLITRFPECKEAVQEAVRFMDELGLTVIHMGNDKLNHWWRSRSAARIEDTPAGPSVVGDWPDGYVIMRRDENGIAELGGVWSYIVVPPGGD